MRKILIILFGILTIYACSKDSLSIEEKEEDTFNSLIGKWQLQRASDTPDFEIEDKEIKEYKEVYKSCLEITSDSTLTSSYYWDELHSSSSKFNIKSYGEQIYLTGDIHFDIRDGWGYFKHDLHIYSLNKNKLVIHPIYMYDESNPYFEYKRIK